MPWCSGRPPAASSIASTTTSRAGATAPRSSWRRETCVVFTGHEQAALDVVAAARERAG
jgi:hypothetical protein